MTTPLPKYLSESGGLGLRRTLAGKTRRVVAARRGSWQVTHMHLPTCALMAQKVLSSHAPAVTAAKYTLEFISSGNGRKLLISQTVRSE